MRFFPHLLIQRLLYVVLLTGPAWAVTGTEPDGRPPQPVWVATADAPPVPVHRLEWDGARLRGEQPDGTPIDRQAGAERTFIFPPPPSDDLGHRPSMALEIRDPVRIPYASLPDALEIRFRIPTEPGLYLLPLVSEDGAPLGNSFQVWIGEKNVTVQGRGFGRTDITEMNEWTRDIPPSQNREVLVQLFIDRKEEHCYLRLNHILVQSWKLPTSFQARIPSKTFVELRSGIDPQRILDFRLLTWPSGRVPDVNLQPTPGKDRIWLRNGDLLPGIAMKIEQGKVWVRLDSGTIIPIPFDRIRELHLLPREGGGGRLPFAE